MTDALDNTWPKSITVDRRIVSVLSQSTYDSFPRALKELITNSYDADARDVKVSIDLINEKIDVFDDGKGMSEGDFEFYLRIAGKDRQKLKSTTDLGRKIIGQFGVGFLSVFPFFKHYHIQSKKKGSSKIIEANVPLHEYFSESNEPVDIGSILIRGGQRPSSKDEIPKSYTRITLTGFNGLTREFFNPTIKGEYKKRLVKTYDGISKIKWILSEDLPLHYSDDKFNEIFNYPETKSFNVSVNGDNLEREIYGHDVLETHNDDQSQVGKIKFKYVIATPRKGVNPFEARGLKIRNLNVGVGDKRTNFTDDGHGSSRSRLHWLTGEVHILEGMNDLIKVSREGFNYSKDYEELKSFLRKRLHFYSNRLEKEAELSREVKQTGKEVRIRNLSLLEPENLNKKLEAFKQEGFSIKSEPNKPDSSKPITISDENKEILISDELLRFEKHIYVKNRRFKLTSDRWDYQSADLPACKIKNDQITINMNYPLFKGKKFTDLFVKFHLLLLFNLEDNTLNSSDLQKINQDFIDIFKDYI